MLDLYYHLYDEDSQESVNALAATHRVQPAQTAADSPSEGTLGATGRSAIKQE